MSLTSECVVPSMNDPISKRIAHLQYQILICNSCPLSKISKRGFASRGSRVQSSVPSCDTHILIISTQIEQVLKPCKFICIVIAHRAHSSSKQTRTIIQPRPTAQDFAEHGRMRGAMVSPAVCVSIASMVFKTNGGRSSGRR